MLQTMRAGARSMPVRRASTLAGGRSALQAAKEQWNGRLSLSPEVEHALQTGAPVVALESAIITHGMPFPTNLETARSVEAIIRSHGVVPATIALSDGKVHVGLGNKEIEALADSATVRAAPAVKVSRRDLAPALAFGRAGGTTVAGTMVVAHSCGIGSFVTGGIGGVHRGAESSMDVSADLIELGRTPMMVVCAGAKSILDIPRTLEYLETQGVCVATYGQKRDFPAFYTPSSGCESPWQVGSIGDAAKLVHTGLTLPSPQATLLAVPIPVEHSARGDTVQTAVEQAVRESVEQGVDKRGKEVTPWLLKRVGELTGGTALELNIKLIENNAHVGAQVAAEVARLRREVQGGPSSGAMPALPAEAVGLTGAAGAGPSFAGSGATASLQPQLPSPRVIVFGSAAMDITSSSPSVLHERTTTPGSITLSPGGVGRNLAHAAQNQLPAGEVQLVAAVGGERGRGLDALGSLLELTMLENDLRTDGMVRREGGRTAACNLVLENGGDLVSGIADMEIAATLTADEVDEAITRASNNTPPQVIAFDCNLGQSTIEAILTAKQRGLSTSATFADPTSVPKMARLLPLLRKHPRALDHISPNGLELDHMYSYLTDHDDGSGWEFINALNLGAEWRASVEALAQRTGAGWLLDHGSVTKMVACLPWVGGFWLKQGASGLVRLGFVGPEEPKSVFPTVRHALPRQPGEREVPRILSLTLYPPPAITPEEIVSTTGAGDTLAGSLVAGIALGLPQDECVLAATEAIGRTLRSSKAVA